ncbi:MAG: hypothetical protein HY962_05145 [Ignavibacteriae bacterium]|nr:hypothetical protein [Ignavibacteriota bacterium]
MTAHPTNKAGKGRMDSGTESSRHRWRQFRRDAMRGAVCCVLLLFGTACSARAQDLLIPVDAEARLDHLSAELERRIHLFPDVSGFLEARLFERADSTYVLVIDHGTDTAPLRSERVMTREQMQDLRREVTNRAHLYMPEMVVDREGRTAFIATCAGLGGTFWGQLIADGFEIRGERQRIGTSLLTAGMSFVVPYALTHSHRVTEGMAALAFQGGLRGLVDGVFLVNILDLRDDTYAFIPLALSLGELSAGYMIADAYNLDAGRASSIAIGGNLGFGIGSSAAVMVAGGDAFNGDGVPGKVAALAGSAVGYATAAHITSTSHYTTGDANVLATFAVMGAAVPSTALVLAEDEKLSHYGTAWVIGGIAGMVYAHSYLERRDFLTSEATFVQLGTGVGALVGLGVGAIAEEAQDRSEGRILMACTMGGALAGFVLTLSAYDRDARAHAQEERSRTSIDISINPAALFVTSRTIRPLPFLSVFGRF